MSNEHKFLKIIKSQSILRVITKEDNINQNIVNGILKFADNVKEIIIILNLCSNLPKALNLIIINFEHLQNICLKSKDKIELTELNDKIVEDQLEQIKEFHNMILEMEKNNSTYFVNFGELIRKYINQFRLSNLDNLIILREMIMNQKKFGDELKGMEFQINNEIHQTGIKISRNLKSYEIINFIADIDKFSYHYHELNTIVKSINIYELNKEYLIKFNEIWNKINNKHDYELVIKLIFNKIDCMKDFGLIFKLIPKHLFNFNYSILLENKFKTLFYSFNEKICLNIINDISNVLSVFHSSIYSPKDFLCFIENKLPKNILNSCYLHIIKNLSLSGNKEIKKRIINFFTKPDSINDVESIIYILENINESKNFEFINDFLNSLDKYIILIQDFYDNNLNNKFKLYKYILKIFYDKDISCNNNYFKKSNLTLNNLYNKITSFEFNYKEAILLKKQIDENYFKEKLILINNNHDDENIQFFLNLLKINIQRIEIFYNQLLMTKNFYSFFFEESQKNFIEDLDKKIQTLNDKNNINYLNELENFFNKEEKFTTAKKYQKLSNSKFFIGILNKLKKDNLKDNEEITLFSKSVLMFYKLEILNKWKDNYSINKIPSYEIISEEIEKIIKENDDNKELCLFLIHKELKIIKYIHEVEKNGRIKNKFKNYKLLTSKTMVIKNNINNNILNRNTEIYNNLINKKIEEKNADIKMENENNSEPNDEEDDKKNEIQEIKKDENIIENDIYEDNKNENIIREGVEDYNEEKIEDSDDEKINEIKINKIQLNNYLRKKYKFDFENLLIYLPFLKSLQNVFHSLKLLIELFKVEKEDFYEDIKNHFNEINRTEEFITLEIIKEKILYLRKLENIDIDLAPFNPKDNITLFIDFLNNACKNEEAINFVFGKTNEEVKALSEFVGENENSKIQIRDIQDFMNVCRFFETIKAIDVKKDKQLIEEFKAAFIETPAFGNSFTNFLNNFKEIKNVYEEYLDKPEVSRKKIEQILKFSNIKLFFNDDNRLFEIIGTYTNILDNDNTFNNNDLQELHDRALLFSNQAFDDIANDVTDNLKKKQQNSKEFVEIVENINQLLNYLTLLYIKGYPNLLKVELIIEKSRVTDINRIKDIKQIISYYKKLAECLEKAQIEAYENRPLIRMIYGKQFYEIYNYIINKVNNIDIIPLLKKISDNKILKIPKIEQNIIEENDIYNFKDILREIDDFLQECLEINQIKIKDCFKKNIIKDEFKDKMKPGFYSWCTDKNNYEIQIISIYKKLTKNLPIPITVLLCTKDTNIEEITSFLYRVVFCPCNALFIIINSDNLELSNAQYFLSLLESLYIKQKTKINSSLLIVFKDSSSTLKNQIALLKEHNYFLMGNIGINDIKDIKNNDIEQNEVKIWTSNAAGVGKSEEIRFEAEQLGLKYLYFPIGGSFTRKEIINRLIKLDIDKNNYKKNYLHIDIYDSDAESSIIIKEFLFCLLITRNYSYDEKTFYFGYESMTVVEIPVGFYNMKDKFKLLNYFSPKNLLINQMPDLREIENIKLNRNEIQNKNEEKELTDIQLVANILLMLENNTIQDNLFELDKNHEKIDLIDCQNIINKYFTLEKGNYYQKMAFIHILADQFKKFCSSFYLKPKILIQNEEVKLERLNLPERRYALRRIRENNTNLIQIRNEAKKITIIRKIMIENLVKLTLYFVKGPYNKLVLNQEDTKIQLFGEFNEEKIKEIANKSLSKKDEIISFDKINPSLVFFNEDIQTFSIITTSKKGEKEYNQLLKLYNSQLNIEQENDFLIDYRNLTHEQFLPQIKNILNLNTLSIEEIKNIIGSYCFTRDNFIKMILILLRTRAGIPVIMMGETGCGKTSLIKILSSLLNKGKMSLKIKNIHAGIKDLDIIEFIEKINEEANNEDNNSNDKIWVFFDEINTCNSMGLLSEIFYKHSYYGKKLSERLTFIAACNPYRLKIINEKEKEKINDDFCLKFNDKKYYKTNQKLVYLVNPLPHSLLTSIFDFGNLSSEDEKKYIQSIVKETLKKYNISIEIEQMIVKEIVECQNYIRGLNDVSSVSLRELRRFNILFDFFIDYFNKKKNIGNKNIYISSLCLCLYFCYYIRLSNNESRKELKFKIETILKEKDYFNIIQKEKEFIASKIKIPPGIAKNSTLLENIFSLFVCIINKIPLIICGKPGTSKSLSFQLLYDSMKGSRSENEFFQNYPELLVFSYQGSKTSTSEGIQKVFNKARNCLKKNKEKNKQDIDNIKVINNNKKKILKPFKNKINIRKEIKDDKNEEKPKIINIKDEVIPVLYFDEMGLAEESPNNPLKVIHSELEYDDNDLKIAFVGISNWKLDASKMNRTIFLGVPPLEKKDLENTAKEISSNLNKELSIKYKDLFSNLVKTYCKYRNEMKSTSDSEFHGLRDFYHLIKNAMHYLINENLDENKKISNIIKEENEKEYDEINDKNNNIDIKAKSYEIGIKSLFRNFDGLKEPINSFEKIKKIFDELYIENAKNYNNNSFNVFDCLKDNIKDNNSRYLLIIMESSMSLHLLNYIMQKLKKKYIFYSGSQLKEDINQKKYNEKLLNKIQLSLENGDVLVLKNMENIYPSLYNLFNQNFTMLGGKKFARIAFANYKSYSVVNDNFRAIVLVDEEQIKKKLEDPPFLNRFEKHSFSFEYLMNEMELKITNKIINYIDLVISFNNNKNLQINLKKQLLWYNKEEIKGLVFREYKEKNIENKIEEEEFLYDNIFKNLSKLFSQDIIASLISIDSDLKEEKMPNNLLKYYQSYHYNNFRKLIKNWQNVFIKNNKLIIYTFSKLLEPCIKNNQNINSDTFRMIEKNNISEKIISSIKTELDLENILDDYLIDKEKKILVFRFSEEDLNKMNQLKIKINQFETEKKNNEKYKRIIQNKYFIFIITLTRQKLEQNYNNFIINDLISNIDEEYKQFFIDNLHGKNDIDIIKTMTKKPNEFITDFIKKENKQLIKLFHQIFSYLSYEFKNEKNENQKDDYLKEMIYKIRNNEYILNLIKEKIEKEFGGDINEIIKSIFVEGISQKNDIEFIDIINRVINDKIFLLVFKFIFKSEKDHFLSPFLFNYEFIKQNKENLTYIEKYINNFEFSLVNVVERINSNQVILILNLNLPLSKKWYDSIYIFIENNIKEDFMNNEEYLRITDIEQNRFEEELEKYSKIKSDFINNVKGEILRIEGLSDLIKTKNKIYLKKIYFDFITIYLSKKFKYNIDLGIKFLDILIQLRLNINKDNKFSFIENNKKKINLQDSFSDLNFNNIKEELNIKYDEETLSKILIFLICYNDEIYSLLEIFYTLNKYLDNFFNDWKEMISNKEIKYEINENNPIYTREINESFFIIYESLIKCIFNNPDKYKNLDEDIFYEYIDALQKISKTAIQIYYKLFLPSKEMYTLQILINIFSSYNSSKNKNNINNIQEIFVNIINNIINENLNINNYQDLLQENYQSLLNLIEKLIDKENNKKEYSLLLNNLFIYRFNKSLNKAYRKAISVLFFKQITNPQLNYILPILKKIISDVEPKTLGYEDFTEKECLNNFMNNFINVENDNLELYKIINEKNIEVLDLNILYYFECECDLYFKKISKFKNINEIEERDVVEYMNEILLNLSFKYFRKAMSFYLNENKFHENADNLGKIYCIAYIKNYLKRLAEFITYNKNKNIINFERIFEVLLHKVNELKIYSIKIFIFKCLFFNQNQNYIEFIDSIKNRNDLQSLLIHDDFGNFFLEKENNHSYNYSFLNINIFNDYCTLNKIIELSVDDFEKNPEFNSMVKIFKSNNFQAVNLLYNILINKYILDLYGKENNNEELSRNANIVFNKFNQININLHPNSQLIINYLINKNLFSSKILSKLNLQNNNMSLEQLYILLICIKFVLSLQCIPNNIFSLFYIDKNNKNDLIQFIKNNFIPGAYPIQNEFIESYYEIINHLNTQPSDSAIYICSCGKYYNILPCGFPVLISKCLKCNLNIGGRNHRLFRRPNHYRIFLNEEAKKKELKKTFADRNMPYKYLDEFKREIIDPILNTPSKGIGKMNKERINKTGNPIRNLNELTIRILNLILCSHILVANILEILDNNDISGFFSEETSCFGIILDNWNKISELLNNKGIHNIQIYMNIILDKIVELISRFNIKDISSSQGRDIIENLINEFINDNKILKEVDIYNNQNQHILNSNPFNISSLIQELYPRRFYENKEKFSYLKYFYYYNYPSHENLYTIIESNNNYKNQYPLTYNVLKYTIEKKNEIELLKYIPKVNKKLNHLIQNYSYKISREDALQKTIKDEYNKTENNLFVLNKNKKDKKLGEYIEDLEKLFNSFEKKELQWGCFKLQKMKLNIDSSLASLLLDDNEPGYYLSSIYRKLIEYQNIFLDNIINCNSQNGLLHCFVKQLNNEIMIQDAGIKEIVKLDFEGNNQNNLKLFTNIDELIFINTSNDTINKFNYELEQIEIELGNIILPGLRKFKSSDDELRYITYMFEGYRGKKSNILTNFNEKYPPKELNNKEKILLNKYIQQKENDDYKTFLFGIQILIDYIQKAGKDSNMKISEIIRNIPDHININESVKSFFNYNDEFTVNKLVRIFELFEHLCWDQIKENLLDEFMKNLEENKVKKSNEYFQKNDDKNNNIKKIELATAIRKFISRYLAGKRSQSEINEDKMLFDYLNRIDLWTRNIDEPNFEKEYYELSKLKINVGEGLKFYDYLGGDSQLLNLNAEEKSIKDFNKIDIDEENSENKNRIIANEDEEEEEEINTDIKKIYNNTDEEDQKDKNKNKKRKHF